MVYLPTFYLLNYSDVVESLHVFLFSVEAQKRRWNDGAVGFKEMLSSKSGSSFY